MTFCPEHPKWDQNPKFIPLSESKSIPTPFILPPPPGCCRPNSTLTATLAIRCQFHIVRRFVCWCRAVTLLNWGRRWKTRVSAAGASLARPRDFFLRPKKQTCPCYVGAGKVLGITKDFLCLSNSKIYEKEPWYNETSNDSNEWKLASKFKIY